MCDTIFYVSPSRNQKYCSIKCAGKSKEGKNNPACRQEVKEKLKLNHHRTGKTLEESYGKSKAGELRIAYGIKNKGKNNPACRPEVGRKISKSKKGCSGEHNKDPEKRRSQRVKMIEIRKKLYGNSITFYNPEACKIIENYGKENGYNFQHAENGGEYHIKELGFWVDGYDKEKNVVIEYYEKHHKYQKERDERRKQEIVDYLGCKFIEIEE